MNCSFQQLGNLDPKDKIRAMLFDFVFIPFNLELDTVEKSRESPPHQSDDNNSQFIDQQMRDFIARAEGMSK